jgi:hypothetical protein
MTQARDAPRLANVVSARLARIFDLADYTHIGGVAEREAGGVVVVIALSRRRVEMAPVPRAVRSGRDRARRPPRGRSPGQARPYAPGGDPITLGQGRFSIRVIWRTRAGTGWRSWARAEGPDVIANFCLRRRAGRRNRQAPAAPARDTDEAHAAPSSLSRGRSKAGSTAGLRSGARGCAGANETCTRTIVGHVRRRGRLERLLRAGVATVWPPVRGQGYSPDEIHSGLMNSPGHRAAILLREATHVGISVVSDRRTTAQLSSRSSSSGIPPLIGGEGPCSRAQRLAVMRRRGTRRGRRAE